MMQMSRLQTSNRDSFPKVLQLDVRKTFICINPFCLSIRIINMWGHVNTHDYLLLEVCVCTQWKANPKSERTQSQCQLWYNLDDAVAYSALIANQTVNTLYQVQRYSSVTKINQSFCSWSTAVLKDVSNHRYQPHSSGSILRLHHKHVA